MDAFKQKFVLADWKFANPKVDYAFKRIFGTEKYKDATINLLNSLLPHLHIVNVEYPNTELVGDTGDSRKACIDVLCTDNSGRQFIIEMQNAEQEHFFERAVFYSSRLISMAAPKGTSWDYSLPPSYVIAFLDFPFSVVTGSRKDDKDFIKHYRHLLQSEKLRQEGGGAGDISRKMGIFAETFRIIRRDPQGL